MQFIMNLYALIHHYLRGALQEEDQCLLLVASSRKDIGLAALTEVITMT